MTPPPATRLPRVQGTLSDHNLPPIENGVCVGEEREGGGGWVNILTKRGTTVGATGRLYTSATQV